MKEHLEVIARSYDKGIECGKKGINLYDQLPSHILDHQDYKAYVELYESGQGSDSKREAIKNFLAPKVGMRLIDLGCCLNLMFNDYDQWASTYYGIDISQKTILLLEDFVASRKLTIGTLHWGSIHETPFEDTYFHIATCIGVLEYFEAEFVEEAIREIHRIMTVGGRVVLDIPNQESPLFEINKQIEAYLGRPDRFNMSTETFNTIIQNFFTIEKREAVAGMLQYYLVKSMVDMS